MSLLPVSEAQARLLALAQPLPVEEAPVTSCAGRWLALDIAARRDHYREVAATGPEFVRRLHNGDFSRDVLMKHFIEA